MDPMNGSNSPCGIILMTKNPLIPGQKDPGMETKATSLPLVHFSLLLP